jgi:hypothetical protein
LPLSLSLASVASRTEFALDGSLWRSAPVLPADGTWDTASATLHPTRAGLVRAQSSQHRKGRTSLTLCPTASSSVIGASGAGSGGALDAFDGALDQKRCPEHPATPDTSCSLSHCRGPGWLGKCLVSREPFDTFDDQNARIAD